MTDGLVVVTGAAGFIGSHVCRALRRRGQRVLGIDNFDPFYPRARKLINLKLVDDPGSGGFELAEMDICNAAALRELLLARRPEGIIHLAAKAGVRPSLADPAGYMHANVTGTASVLEAARAAGCRRVSMASSSSVYGNCKAVPFSEEMDVSEPISPYAASKRACELIAFTHHHVTQMPTACLRFFTVYGPGQRPDLAIGAFMGKVARGEAITMFGNGDTSRDYTFIDDIVAGVLASYDRIDRHGYRVWNLGNSRPVKLTEMIDTVAAVVGKPARIEHSPMQMGDVERTFADLTRATAELGYRPTTDLQHGAAAQWAWMREALPAELR